MSWLTGAFDFTWRGYFKELKLKFVCLPSNFDSGYRLTYKQQKRVEFLFRNVFFS